LGVVTVVPSDHLGRYVPDTRAGLVGSGVHELERFLDRAIGLSRDHAQPATVWPAAAVSSEQLRGLPLQSIAVATNGSVVAIEQARTELERAYPYAYSPATIAETKAQNPNTQLDSQYQQLVDVVILTSLVIAGCSLAVSVAAGLSDRKRPFRLLRLTGALVGMLRRVVALESAVPLLVIAALSSATGFLAAGLFLRSQLSETLQAPGAEYYLIVLAGLVVSLAVIASTLPLLERLTGPETARNE
jgi:predicted lysophospholipase L1 biosynthesis ABC-type transport system permease subunit